jgi:hypothetical protein
MEPAERYEPRPFDPSFLERVNEGSGAIVKAPSPPPPTSDQRLQRESA